MSASTPIQTLTPLAIRDRKGKEPIVCLTAYTTPIARLADAACDVVLVGDSVGMVLHGLPSTLGVTMEMMTLHGKAVMRGVNKALCVVDMPFGSYEESPAQAFRNASRLLAETGAAAVKLEGGVSMKETIAFLIARGVPVMGHIGLTPQAVNVLGGYKVQGRNEDAQRVIDDAHAVEDAGAFAIVLEKLPRSLGADITDRLGIPTIGIGAGPECDGQILVIDDMLGLFADFKPKFVKRYATLAEQAEQALATYAQEVRSRVFPGPEHSFGERT